MTAPKRQFEEICQNNKKSKYKTCVFKMISNADLFFEEIHTEIATNMYRLRRSIRDSSNPLELPHHLFVSNFRLTKEAFVYVLDQIKDQFVSMRTSSIPPIIKLACALRFFADGSYQKSVGNDFDLGLAQPTVSVVLHEVLDVFQSVVCKEWIITEMTENEKQQARNSFFVKTGFPGVVGCVDGTHIGIVAPSQLRHQYLNRKGYYSLNAIIACDHSMVIRYVDGRYPGSNHDSFIWNSSELKTVLARWYRNGERSSMYLGDSGYPLHPYLMTPFRNASPGSNETRYNKVHAKARNIIERTIGVLKSRFRCLLTSERKLHYSPKTSTQIIYACCALHNICQYFNIEPANHVLVPETSSTVENEIIDTNNDLQDGQRRRLQILNSIVN